MSKGTTSSLEVGVASAMGFGTSVMSLSSADWASLVAQAGRHSSVQRGASRRVGLEPGLGRGLRFPGNPGSGGETGRAQQAGGLLGVQHTCPRGRSCPWCVHGPVRLAAGALLRGDAQWGPGHAAVGRTPFRACLHLLSPGGCLFLPCLYLSSFDTRGEFMPRTSLMISSLQSFTQR